MARLLIANEQGGTLAQLVVDPMQPLQHRTLGGIMVHTAAVFFCQQRIDILQPFVNMLNNPAALVVSRSMNYTPHCDKRFYYLYHCCCRMLIYQQCLKTTLWKQNEFFKGNFMVYIFNGNFNSSFINAVVVLNLYFRMSKRSPLLCGTGKNYFDICD